MVGSGHLTESSEDISYCGIVSLKNVQVVLFIGALNDLAHFDIGSAYLEAYTREKLYIIVGSDFKELEGYMLLVNKAVWFMHVGSTLVRYVD